MKTIAKLIMSAIVLFGITITANSCKKDEQASGTEGYMTVKMTDAPANYLAVNVEVIGLNVNTESQGWINIPIRPGIYNLLDLQNNVTVVLAKDSRMPIGKTTQIRLLLGEKNSVVTAEGEFALKVPSGEESGVKINIDETIKSNEHVEVVLDFDANKSVVLNGNGEFHLKPVIKVKSVTEL